MNRSRRRRQSGHLLLTPLLVGKAAGIVLAIWTTAWDQISKSKGDTVALPTLATLLSFACLGGMLLVWGIGRRLESRADAVQPRTPAGKILWGVALTVLVLSGLLVYGLLAFGALTFATLRYS
jgi:hypothetical protein